MQLWPPQVDPLKCKMHNQFIYYLYRIDIGDRILDTAYVLVCILDLERPPSVDPLPLWQLQSSDFSLPPPPPIPISPYAACPISTLIFIMRISLRAAGGGRLVVPVGAATGCTCLAFPTCNTTSHKVCNSNRLRNQ